MKKLTEAQRAALIAMLDAAMEAQVKMAQLLKNTTADTADRDGVEFRRQFSVQHTLNEKVFGLYREIQQDGH